MAPDIVESLLEKPKICANSKAYSVQSEAFLDWKESSWIHILIVSVTIIILRLTNLEISIQYVTFTH